MAWNTGAFFFGGGRRRVEALIPGWSSREREEWWARGPYGVYPNVINMRIVPSPLSQTELHSITVTHH